MGADGPLKCKPEMTNVNPSLRIQSATEVKKQASQIQIKFADEIAKMEPFMAQIQSKSTKDADSNEQYAADELYPDDMSSPFGDSYDGVFDDSFGVLDEQTSASQIAKIRIKSISQEKESALSNPHSTPLKPIEQLRSPSTPTPSAIQKIKLNTAKSSSPSQESQELILNPTPPNLPNQAVQDARYKPNKAYSTPEDSLSPPAIPPNIPKKGKKLQFVALGLVIIATLGLVLINSGPNKSENLSTPNVPSTKSDQSVAGKVTPKLDLDLATLELDINEPIELKTDAKETSSQIAPKKRLPVVKRQKRKSTIATSKKTKKTKKIAKRKTKPVTDKAKKPTSKSKSTIKGIFR